MSNIQYAQHRFLCSSEQSNSKFVLNSSISTSQLEHLNEIEISRTNST